MDTPKPHVQTSRGSITGTVISDGERRWKKPQPLPASFKYDADGRTYAEVPARCWQPDNYDLLKALTGTASPRPSMTEDCLYVNIWTPPSRPQGGAGGLPVLFYIHGGWLQMGSPHAEPIEDPSDLVALSVAAGKPMLIVSVSYRLNCFGFFAHHALAGEADSGQTTGNYGFWDQEAALRWTVENIAAFGGDPQQITMWGLSAGAHSVHSQALHCFQRSDTSAPPPFKRIFMQSNAVVLPPKHVDEVSSAHLDELCAQLLPAGGIGASGTPAEKIAALRRVPAQDIVEAIPRMQMHTFRATYDGREQTAFLRADTIEAMADGRFARWLARHGVDFIIGEVHDEEQLYRVMNPPSGEDMAAAMQLQIANYYPQAYAKALISAYPELLSGAATTAWHERFGHITSDSQVYAAERLFLTDLLGGSAHFLAEDGRFPAAEHPSILRYRIDYRAPIADLLACPKWMGVAHGFDNAIWWLKERRANGKWPAHELATVKEKWLAPFLAFVGGEPIDQIKRDWYGGASSSAESGEAFKGGPVRVLTPECDIKVIDDERWDAKLPLVRKIAEMRSGTAL